MADGSINALMSRLSTFRPSDRAELDRAFHDARLRDAALDAVKQFVIGWERADWLEAYSIERIGKWMAKSQSDETLDALGTWARSYETNARLALLKGFELGLEKRELTHA